MTNDVLRPENIRPGMLFCDRYRIERRLDDGGMATVWLAVDQESGLSIAIKVLFVRYHDNPIIRARFLDEGRIQAMLDHPNIVHVYNVIEEPILSFVMEFIDGDSLEEYLQRKSRLNEEEIVNLMLPVMSAVGFAHSKGIVHRDIKPSNILLKPSAGYLEPKIMDFGVAKINRGKELTVAGTTVGTLHYMSPEQIVGARDIDGRADIYSLGCSLYKLCTGEVPFNASSEFALMMAQVEAPPTPPTKLQPDISEALEQIILTALAKEPANRFQTIKQMTKALIALRGPSKKQRSTITRPIPNDLLQFAMDADEVVQDQTEEFRLESQLDIDAEDLREFARREKQEEDIDQTSELSSSAIFKIERDRVEGEQRHEKETRDLARPSIPQNTDEIETIERKPVRRDQLSTVEEVNVDRRSPRTREDEKSVPDHASQTMEIDEALISEIIGTDDDQRATIEQGAWPPVAEDDDDQTMTIERDAIERAALSRDFLQRGRDNAEEKTSRLHIDDLASPPRRLKVDDEIGMATTTERSSPRIQTPQTDNERTTRRPWPSPAQEGDGEGDDKTVEISEALIDLARKKELPRNYPSEERTKVTIDRRPRVDPEVLHKIEDRLSKNQKSVDSQEVTRARERPRREKPRPDKRTSSGPQAQPPRKELRDMFATAEELPSARGLKPLPKPPPQAEKILPHSDKTQPTAPEDIGKATNRPLPPPRARTTTEGSEPMILLGDPLPPPRRRHEPSRSTRYPQLRDELPQDSTAPVPPRPDEPGFRREETAFQPVEANQNNSTVWLVGGLIALGLAALILVAVLLFN